MLEDRIGFVVGQKLDDEIPVVVSIMTSYSASANVLPRTVTAWSLNVPRIHSLVHSRSSLGRRGLRLVSKTTHTYSMNDVRVLHHLGIFAHQDNILSIFQRQRPQQQPLRLYKNTGINYNHLYQQLKEKRYVSSCCGVPLRKHKSQVPV